MKVFAVFSQLFLLRRDSPVDQTFQNEKRCFWIKEKCLRSEQLWRRVTQVLEVIHKNGISRALGSKVTHQTRFRDTVEMAIVLLIYKKVTVGHDNCY